MATVSSVARELRKKQIRDTTLALGQPGVALLFAYLVKARPDRGHEEIALRFLERAAQSVSAKKTPASLYSGLTGVAWTITHLKPLLGLEGKYPNAKIDRALETYLRASSWRGEYDLISGLTGLGIYALECLPQPSAVRLLKRVVDHLDSTAIRNSHGCTWLSRVEFLSHDWRKSYPNGCYDLGLAHGVPGVIALLGRICGTQNEKLRATRTTARKLLDGAVSWLLRQKSSHSKVSVFPTCVAEKTAPPIGGSRLAWCYGDLGIATALLLAARCVSQATWEVEALSLARHAARRSFKQSGVIDTGLCHGAAGVAHLFNRLYQATGERVFRDAARYWFHQTMKMRRLKYGVAGFPARLYKRSIGKHWSAQPGLLYGAAGIALALLSAVTPVEPAWDRVMLASMR